MNSFKLAGAAAALLISGAASAAVVSGSMTDGSAKTAGGVFTIISPPTMTGNNNQTSNNVFAWNEKQNYTLGANLLVDIGSTIVAGTKISVHGITFDPRGSETVEFFAKFDRPILGIITSRGLLMASDYLGAPGTTYNSPGSRGLEANDLAHTSFFGSVLTVADNGRRQRDGWTASNPGDNIRVITAAVPEPATWAMLISGFGMVGFAARRRRAGVTLASA